MQMSDNNPKTTPAHVPAYGDEGVGADGPGCEVELKAADYKSGRRPVWCAGCGDYGVLNSIFNALAELQVSPDNLAVISGIGCSSRLPGYMKAYGFHGAHGRAVPVACGVKVANPALTVLTVGGDGDGFSIGGGHVSHACRRNIDLTYIVMDNEIYGLTKGQISPTSPVGARAKSNPYGTVERPINPLLLVLAYGGSFVARGYASQPKQLVQLVADGMRHKGLSFIHVLTPCVTFNKAAGYDFFKERVQDLPADHKTDDLMEAMRLAADESRFYTGLFYKSDRPEYTDGLRRSGRKLESPPPVDIEAMIHQFS
jgi:2-oxoglutarate/2-oxoacid ferredoxin oxidoreductase subunit beta